MGVKLKRSYWVRFRCNSTLTAGFWPLGDIITFWLMGWWLMIVIIVCGTANALIHHAAAFNPFRSITLP